MPLDFPGSPTNGQVYQNYYYDSSAGAWRSLSSTVNPIPSTLKNVIISSSENTGVSLKVTPFTTSSVNLQEWYNTTPSVVASMNVAGDLTVNSLTLTNDLSVSNGGTGTSSLTGYVKGNGTSAFTAQAIPIPISDGGTGSISGVNLVPTGCIMMWYTDTPPSGWLLCNGQSTSGYSALAAIVGANVPNLQGRVPVGKDSAQTEFDVLGETGGAKTHTLSVSEMPSHNHGGSTGSSVAYSDNLIYAAGGSTNFVPHTWGGAYVGADPAYQNKTSHSHSITAQGGGSAHNNLQPYIVINYIIKT